MNLMETATRDVGSDVCSLDVSAVPGGRNRSLFDVVGCRDSTARLLSLAPGKGSLLEQRSSCALGATRPHLVALSNVGVGGDGAGGIALTVSLYDGSALHAYAILCQG